MAYVDGPINISYNFQDDDLATASESIKLPPGTALADAHTYAQSYAALLRNVSDCALRTYIVSQSVYDDTYPVGAAGSDVEDKGVLTMRTANNGSMTITWPGIIESILVNTISRKGTYIDLTHALVAPIIAALVSGLVTGLTTTQPSDRRGADIIGVKDAYKQNRSSQKSMGFKG